MSTNRRHSSHDHTAHERQRDRWQTKLRDGAALSLDDERVKRAQARIKTHVAHLNAARGAIKASLASAGLEHADDAVVLLLDLTDERAKAIADTCVDRAGADGLVAVTLGSGARPFGTLSMRNQDAVSLLSHWLPVIAADIAVTPYNRGVCIVVVVAEGVASAHLLPLTAGQAR